jgi:hypothetical protein
MAAGPVAGFTGRDLILDPGWASLQLGNQVVGGQFRMLQMERIAAPDACQTVALQRLRDPLILRLRHVHRNSSCQERGLLKTQNPVWAPVATKRRMFKARCEG